MGWRTVIITQHAKVSYGSRQLIVQTIDGTNQIPVSDIQVLLVGTMSAVITTAAINALIQVNAKIIFTGRDGQPVCETLGYYPSNRDADLITKQMNWQTEDKIKLWTKIIYEKIRMQIQVYQLLHLETNALNDELLKLELGDPTNREAVVARKYFNLVFDNDFSRRDFSPINAALNYGYSILLSTINREIVTNGYLTQFGVHHHNESNEFNLGSDLMEPFRPIVDCWIAQQQFNEFTPDLKIGLVDLLNLELVYNDEKTILRNALNKYVTASLNFLSGRSKLINIKVALLNEVSSHAINDHV